MHTPVVGSGLLSFIDVLCNRHHQHPRAPFQVSSAGISDCVCMLYRPWVALMAPFILVGWLLWLPLVSSMCCRNRHHWHPRAPFLVAVRGYLFRTASACSIGPLYFSSGGSYSSLFYCVRGKDPFNTHFNCCAFASFVCCFILFCFGIRRSI